MKFSGDNWKQGTHLSTNICSVNILLENLEVIVEHKMKMDHQHIRKERTDCTGMHKQNPEGIPVSP